MIVRVRLEVWIPHDLFAELHFTINHRSRLAVTAAQVEANAAAIQVPANRTRLRIFRGQFGTRHDLERVTIVLHANHVVVKFAELVGPVVFLQPIDISIRAAQVNLPTATLPQEKFHHAFEVTEIIRLQLVVSRKQHGAVMNHGAISLLEANADVHGRTGIASCCLEGTVHQNRRAKGGMEFRKKLRFGQKIHVTHFSGRESCSVQPAIASQLRE